MKAALIGNTIFSACSGTGLIIFAGPIGEMLGVANEWVLLGIGIGLILFVLQLIVAIRKPSTKTIKGIIVQDGMWVAGTAVIIGFDLFGLTSNGKVLMTVVAAIVALLAILQQRHLKYL